MHNRKIRKYLNIIITDKTEEDAMLSSEGLCFIGYDRHMSCLVFSYIGRYVDTEPDYLSQGSGHTNREHSHRYPLVYNLFLSIY